MEVDNELDQTLLQQFSCMGTTDKDDLIKQLQKLVGNDLNTSAASFFLDMNNWNLQAAICSYFDFQSPFNLPSMVLVRDVTIGEGESVPPNTKFTKTWRVQNDGEEDWPPGCELQITDGDSFESPPSVRVEALTAGGVTDISVDMVSPIDPGIYQSKWRMVTPTGSYFGDTIWVILTVAEGGTLALTQQLSHLDDLGSSPRSNNLGNPFHPTREATNQGTIVPHIIFQQEGQTTQEEDSPMMLCTRTPPSGTS